MREMKGEGPKKSLEQQRYVRAIFIYGLVALPLPRPAAVCGRRRQGGRWSGVEFGVRVKTSLQSPVRSLSERARRQSRY